MGVCEVVRDVHQRAWRLACNTQIAELGTPLVTVAPLPNFSTIKDLVPDLFPMFDAHMALHPYIIRDDVEKDLMNGTDRRVLAVEGGD
jgi:succinate dehydrogenase/fumarate reductase-like Fe-S protein